MIKHIQEKIEALRSEIKAIDYTSNANNLKVDEYQELRLHELKSKIQVLNEVIMTYKPE